MESDFGERNTYNECYTYLPYQRILLQCCETLTYDFTTKGASRTRDSRLLYLSSRDIVSFMLHFTKQFYEVASRVGRVDQLLSMTALSVLSVPWSETSALTRHFRVVTVNKASHLRYWSGLLAIAFHVEGSNCRLVVICRSRALDLIAKYEC